MAGRISGVLLIAQPGRVSASLRVLLKPLYPFIQIEQINDIPTMLPLLAPDWPVLVIIDADLPGDEGWRIAAEIKNTWPRFPLMLLAHDVNQEERIRRSGFVCLLLEGITTARLSEAIGDYLQG